MSLRETELLRLLYIDAARAPPLPERAITLPLFADAPPWLISAATRAGIITPADVGYAKKKATYEEGVTYASCC